MEGLWEGLLEGAVVGQTEGSFDGRSVVGLIEGDTDGTVVGSTEGVLDGDTLKIKLWYELLKFRSNTMRRYSNIKHGFRSSKCNRRRNFNSKL